MTDFQYEAPIFNFAINDAFYLSQDASYVTAFPGTEMVIGVNNVVGFIVNKNIKQGGVFIKLGTVPSDTYHVFVTGKLLLGSRVEMNIYNVDPEMRLSQPQTWFMSTSNNLKTVSFKALTYQTIITFKTYEDICLNYSPFEFILSQLTILSDQIILPGYFDAPTGPVGPTGPQGIAIPGPTGPTGPTGWASMIVGPTGLEEGPVGPTGEPGKIGKIGKIGYAGEQGPMGPEGIMGPPGVRGAAGPTGPSTDVILDLTQQVDWFRGSLLVLENSPIYYQKTNDQVVLSIDAFSFFNADPTNGILNSSILPADIQSPITIRYPCIIELNGVNVQSVLDISNKIFIYKNLSLNRFLSTDSVGFPMQTFTYNV